MIKKHPKYAAALLLFLVISLALTANIAFAEQIICEADNGWIQFAHGGRVYIPSEFSHVELDHDDDFYGYYYDFYYEKQDMLIMLSEVSVDEYIEPEEELIDQQYTVFKKVMPEAVYDVKKTNWFELSCYDGDFIYYIRCAKANEAIYYVWFSYPTENRKICDKIVEQVCADFSTERSDLSAESEEYEICWKCHGRRFCVYCGGDGRWTIYNGERERCPFCAGLGKCSICFGRGYIEH